MHIEKTISENKEIRKTILENDKFLKKGESYVGKYLKIKLANDY